MAKFENLGREWGIVLEYGDWSDGQAFVAFPREALSPAQWALLEELPDTERLYYARAILNGDVISAREIEQEAGHLEGIE